MNMSQKQIEQLLRKTLLQDGEMAHGLYKFELEEHLEYWHEGLVADRNDFVFVVTANNGNTAMVLLMPNRAVFVNEKARAKLKTLWPIAYTINMQKLIPKMAEDLADDILAVQGVTLEGKRSPQKKKRSSQSKGKPSAKGGGFGKP